MEEHFKNIDMLIRKQQFQKCLTKLGKLQNELNTKVNNPEESSEAELVLFTIYKILQSNIYERYAQIFIDINQVYRAMQYLINMIKIEKELFKTQNDKESILRLCNSYAKIGRCCFYCCYYEQTFKYLDYAYQLLIKHNLKQTGVYAMTLTLLGNYYRFMFQDDLAEQMLFESIKIREELYTRQSIEVADSLHGLSQLFSDEGKIEEAMNSITEAISIWTEVLGYQHIKTAKSIYLKGNLYLRMKNTQENLSSAEKLITESLEINLKIIGESSQDIADCYHSLGKIQAQNLNSNVFEQYFKKSQDILKTLYGDSHASIAIILNNFGRSYFERKQYEEAVNCFEESIKIYTQLCGKMHGNLAITLKNCADCHKELGRYKQAYLDYQKSLEIYQKMQINSSQVNQLQNLMSQISDKYLED
ncbi:unnamed protein product (macronuclear) [Paramecium tetraurelia]|uniref:MalT-like TPR region domain-containing protein n=1 Tax=Paramecium tetraurelia TaxID=5888 RepID=A0DES6_PARTE|nr:uncharacterized protein GSPATT00016369001 [Paramecium tetraurelia]CAK81543.1 unnamed protein product [Paramecium tetraurelia]|eukprot:XP_001448940.1 hypothetical protein (macronuclear) [Paramecium tetraurelia strain d4-2]